MKQRIAVVLGAMLALAIAGCSVSGSQPGGYYSTGYQSPYPQVYSAGPGQGYGAYDDQRQWRDAYWWHQNRPDWFWQNHPEWASVNPQWRDQDGDYDQNHVWHYGHQQHREPVPEQNQQRQATHQQYQENQQQLRERQQGARDQNLQHQATSEHQQSTHQQQDEKNQQHRKQEQENRDSKHAYGENNHQ